MAHGFHGIFSLGGWLCLRRMCTEKVLFCGLFPFSSPMSFFLFSAPVKHPLRQFGAFHTSSTRNDVGWLASPRLSTTSFLCGYSFTGRGRFPTLPLLWARVFDLPPPSCVYIRRMNGLQRLLYGTDIPWQQQVRCLLDPFSSSSLCRCDTLLSLQRPTCLRRRSIC